MQRKIEFRGKHIDTGEWYFGCLLEGEDTIFIRDKVRHEKHGYLTHPVIPETIGQFTGLKDKNGVKIFEGDIVKSPDGDLEEITYDSITFNLLIAYASDKQKYLNEFKIGDISQELEVVGNIHDNPELLNK